MPPLVLVKQGSLTDGQELVLVNASNTNARLGSGVSGAIRNACGPGFQDKVLRELEAAFKGPMAPGGVLVTDAGAHPHAKWVAHVAVMDYRRGFTAESYPTLSLVEKACQNLWPAIESIPAPELSVAMVALGAGTGQLGVRDSTRVACTTLRAHGLATAAESHIHRVVFYGFGVVEYATMVEVVSDYFEIPAETLPAEVRDYVSRVKKEERS